MVEGSRIGRGVEERAVREHLGKYIARSLEMLLVEAAKRSSPSSGQLMRKVPGWPGLLLLVL